MIFRALCLSLLLASSAMAEWVPVGGNQYIWTDLVGQPDGRVYGWSHGNHGYATSYVIRSMSAAELQAYGVQQPQQQQYQQQDYPQQSQTKSLRLQLLQMAQQRQERQEELELIDALGLGNRNQQINQQINNNSPPVTSPSGGVNLQGYSQQYGGSSIRQQYGNVAGDLPLQQGNTVYGSYDNTYNGQADPFRNFDVQALLNNYLSLAQQVEQGSSRIRTEVGATINQTTESYRLIRETESRLQGMAEIISRLEPVLRANESKVFRFSAGIDGKPIMQEMPEGPPPGGPPGSEKAPPPKSGGPPTGAPPGDDLAMAAAGAGRPSQAEFAAMTKIMSSRCVACHGGAQTGPKQPLRLGTGRSVSFDSLTDEQVGKIGTRVANGSMPQDSKLSESEKALILKFFPPAQKR